MITTLEEHCDASANLYYDRLPLHVFLVLLAALLNNTRINNTRIGSAYHKWEGMFARTGPSLEIEVGVYFVYIRGASIRIEMKFY